MPRHVLIATLLGLLLTGCPDSAGPPTGDVWNSGADDSGGCGPATCSGCCNFNSCVGGTNPVACGAGGRACQQCSEAEQCVGGFCQSGSGACDPTTCGGCCNEFGCQPGTSTAACGMGGGQCEVCSGGDSCQMGSCVPDSSGCASSCSGCCDGSSCEQGNTESYCGTGGEPCSSCGSGASCVQGSCQGGSGTSYEVVAVKAVVDPGYSGCDILPKKENCDMYFKVKIGPQGTEYSTDLVKDSATATWNAVLTVASKADLMTKFDGVLSDENPGIIPDNQIGQCCPKQLSESDLTSGSIELTCFYLDSKCKSSQVNARVTIEFNPK